MPGSVIVGGARTPIGKLSGSLKDIPAVDLGGIAISAALQKAGITGDQVDYVIMGQVIQAGAGQITARQAAVKGGIPMTVPGRNRQQGLPVRAERDRLGRSADRLRRVRHRGRRRHGVHDQGPYLLPGARAGYRYGDATIVDATCARRAVLRVRPTVDGRRHRRLQQRQGDHSRRAGRVRGDEPRAGRPARARTGCSTTRSFRCRFRSARASRCSSPTMRGSARVRPSRALAKLSPAFAPTAPSPPARPAKSRTARQRSLS